MENIVLTIHLIIALCLIGIVLIQRSEGGGLGIGGGGGAITGRPGISALGKLTWLFGIGFVITSIALTVIATQNSGSSSVLDNGALLPPAVEAPAGSDLLPPVGTDAPLQPPRADN